MDRRAEVLKHVDRAMTGVEIGPWHSPLAPKADGYHCLVMDVFDTAALKARAALDLSIAPESADRIEEVDLVGTPTELGRCIDARGLAGRIDYIVSSHNVEHLPDPLSFFQQCAQVLRPGGTVSLAIPDKRACFDFFRPFTPLSQWLEAHFDRRTRPTEAQLFELSCLGAEFDRGGCRVAAFDLDHESPEHLVPFDRVVDAHAAWSRRLAAPDDEYRDTHCWAFTPASFELLARDAGRLGLLPLEVVEVTATRGFEFFAHLRKTVCAPDAAQALATSDRTALLQRVVDENGANSLMTRGLRRRADDLAAEAERLRGEWACEAARLQADNDDLRRRCEFAESRWAFRLSRFVSASFRKARLRLR